MNNASPCIDCPDRNPPCWGTCEKYLAWKAERDKVVNARYESKQRNDMIDDFRFKRQKNKKMR